MTDNLLIPISDEQAKLGQEALKALQGLGGFLRETFGTVPADVVGVLGGDFIKIKRAENLARTIEKARERLRREKVDASNQSAPLSLGLPIMIAAAEESRDELQDLWAALLAAIVDPNRKGFFRFRFIDIAKHMDPLDAPVLLALESFNAPADHQNRLKMAERLGVSTDQVWVSLKNLQEFGLVAMSSSFAHSVEPLGRELLRAIKLTGNQETTK